MSGERKRGTMAAAALVTGLVVLGAFVAPAFGSTYQLTSSQVKTIATKVFNSKIKTASADRVDALHAKDLGRVGFSADNSGDIYYTDGSNMVLLTSVTVTAPKTGFLELIGSAQAGVTGYWGVGWGAVDCFLVVDEVAPYSSWRTIMLDGAYSPDMLEACAASTVIPVQAGTHTIDFYGWGYDEMMALWYPTLSAHYTPYDGAGRPPTSFAIEGTRDLKAFHESRLEHSPKGIVPGPDWKPTE